MATIKTADKKMTVCGRRVQMDRSGAGCCWVEVSAGSIDLPANIAMEIECEIIDGRRDECDGMTMSNGIAYRW